MHRKTKSRLLYILMFLALITSGVILILYNLNQSIIFFYPPSQIHQASGAKEVRVGGIVKAGSIIKEKGSSLITFVITDNQNELTITYSGLLPALFRENQGIVAKGKLKEKIFLASELLTKHDENYMPPEIARTLKEPQKK